MYGGIDQLVDTYKGNPQPLAEKMQKSQQGQPPGRVPPDLEEAIALQKIAELRNSAQGQQAMQAGGAQPSIVDKLKQMIGQNQMQAQMQGQPVMAASGGSIDQLMSNLGQHYAGGGIVAFKTGNEVEDPEKLTEEEARDIMRRIRQRTDMRPESMAVTDMDTTSIPGFVAGNRFQQEMDRASGKREPMTPQQMEANVKPAPREESPREPYSGPQQYTLQQQGADYVARKQAAREAKVKEDAENEARRQALVSQIPTGGPTAPASTGRMPGELERNLSNTLAAMPGASVRKAFSGSGIRGLMGLLGIAGDREEKPAAEPVRGGRTTMANDPRLGKLDTTPTGPGAPAAPTANVPAAPRPSAGGPNVGKPNPPTNANAAATKLDPNGLRALSERMIREEMGLNPETESDKMVARARKLMGMDEILNEKRTRVSDFEKAVAESKANRTPEWIKALQAAGGAPVRGGIGMLLGQMGAAATKTREGYDSQDLEYKRELNRLRDIISDAQLSGNKELAKTAMDAYKEVDARRKAGLTSATSLLNTDATTETSRQNAKDAAAARAQTAAIQAQNVALAREERIRQFNEEQLRKIRQNDVDLANKIEGAIAKRTAMIDMSLQSSKLKPEEEAALLARRNAIVKQVRAEYPSAGAGAANIPPPPANAVREIKK
jgi:hypothetical protein